MSKSIFIFRKTLHFKHGFLWLLAFLRFNFTVFAIYKQQICMLFLLVSLNISNTLLCIFKPLFMLLTFCLIKKSNVSISATTNFSQLVVIVVFFFFYWDLEMFQLVFVCQNHNQLIRKLIKIFDVTKRICDKEKKAFGAFRCSLSPVQ